MSKRIMKPQEKQRGIEEPEQAKAVKQLESRNEARKEDNQSVKLAMAEELIEMGITRISAHRILNISQSQAG